MQTTSCHHVAIICFNCEQSKKFYVKVSGFSIIQDTSRAVRNSDKLDLRIGSNTQI